MYCKIWTEIPLEQYVKLALEEEEEEEEEEEGEKHKKMIENKRNRVYRRKDSSPDSDPKVTSKVKVQERRARHLGTLVIGRNKYIMSYPWIEAK